MRRRFAFDLPLQAPRIRQARADDVAALARVSLDTWRLTYSGILPAGYLERMSLTEQEMQRRRLMASPGTAHFLAEEPFTGEAVAFASCGPARIRAEFGVGEVYELYVQHGFQRQGLGRALLGAARDWLARRGERELVIRVLMDNPARGFYERLGGRPAGVRTIRVGGALVEEAAYVWSDLKPT
ncbi:MAG TPA: GNAT family N-acetyltransferase [Caulobacteraceae bacterium]|nr:GNAT family N-acetyltransferase [Caulobacteraceae bacterium]